MQDENWNVEAPCGHTIFVRPGEPQIHNCKLEERLKDLEGKIAELEYQSGKAYEFEQEMRERHVES